jgi:hypothetical protein
LTESLRALILVPLLPFAITLGILWPWRSERPRTLLRLLSGSSEPEHLRSAEMRTRLQRLTLMMLRRRRRRLPLLLVAPVAVFGLTAYDLLQSWVCLRRVQNGGSDGPKGALFFEWARSLPLILRFSLEMPGNYVRQRWYLAEQRYGIEHFMPKTTRNGALGALANMNGATEISGHFSKLEFYRRCKRAGLASPTVYSLFEDGECVEVEAAVPDRNLFSKAVCSARAEGLYLLWEHLGNGMWRTELKSGEEQTFDLAELRDFLAAESVTWGPMLLQAAIANHQEVQAFAGSRATCCVRIPSCRFPDGRIELPDQYPVFKRGGPDAVVDNEAYGASVYRLDATTGAVRPPFPAEARDRAEPPSFTLPHWQAAQELCVKAHASEFTEFLVIAWDLAISPEGPVLLEGNTRYGGPGEHRNSPACYSTSVGDCIRARLETVDRPQLDC